jgi:hypothetical protein
VIVVSVKKFLLSNSKFNNFLAFESKLIIKIKSTPQPNEFTIRRRDFPSIYLRFTCSILFRFAENERDLSARNAPFLN